MIHYVKKAYFDHKQHIPNLLWQFVYASGKQAFVLGVFFLCAAMLTPYEFGLYNYATAILLLFILFGDFGVSAAASKYVAELKAVNEERERAVLFNASIFTVVFILLSAVLVIIFAPHLLQEKAGYVLVLLPSLLFLPLAYLYAGIYRGVGRFKTAAAIVLLVSIFSIICAYFLIAHFGLKGALWSNNLFSFLLLASLAAGYRDWSSKIDLHLMKSIGNYSLILGVSGLSFYLYSRVDIIFLGHFGHISEIGFYELINKVFFILMAPFMVIAQAIAPKVAGLQAQKKYILVFHTFRQFIAMTFAASLAITIFAYLIAPVALNHFFPQYNDALFLYALYLMLIILVGQCIGALTGIGFSVSTGHAKVNMHFLLFFGLLNIPVTYFFIKYFGFMGAVYSTIIIRCMTDILFIGKYYFILKRHASLGIHTETI